MSSQEEVRECPQRLWEHVQQREEVVHVTMIHQRQHQQQVEEVPTPMTQEEVVAGAEALEPAPDLPVADLLVAVSQRQICQCSSDDIWHVVGPGRGWWMCGGCGVPRLKTNRPGPVEPKPLVEPSVKPNHEKRPLCIFVCTLQ